MSDDFLWDGTGSPDAAEEHFERVAMLFERAPLRTAHTIPVVVPRPPSTWRGAVVSVLLGAAIALGVVYGLRSRPQPASLADDAAVAGRRGSAAASTREILVPVPRPREPNDELASAVPEPVAPATPAPTTQRRRPGATSPAKRPKKTPTEHANERTAETSTEVSREISTEVPTEIPTGIPTEVPSAPIDVPTEPESETPRLGLGPPHAGLGASAHRVRAQAGDPLRDQVETYANQIASCFDEVAPVASGAMVVMGFDLTAEGSVLDPERVRDTLGDARAARRVGACLGRMLRRWRFPAAPGPRRIEAPFIHTAQGVDP